ncbi:MAG: relaxase [Zavarzinia sp.]|nr:relaxase [Zavarzinia sp.]
MILVGNQRGGARDLARHLMKAENERVQVAELRGFVADDLDGALQESYAISRGTKCKQHMFSLSLNPPKDASVSDEEFKQAIERVENKLGLTGQPRAIVFHEKYGDDGKLRRHAHAVWSRIDTQQMKAVPLPHSRLKLQDIARDLYLEHGWTMPRGLAVTGDRDPRNFTLAEWQQAKRRGDDPRTIKAAFQDAWAISDSRGAFTNALQERGYWLVQGDRRSYVAVDHRGEVYAIAKWTGVRTKAVRERLGEADTLPSVADAKRDIARAMEEKMEAFRREVAAKEERERQQAQAAREALKQQQGERRSAFQEAAQQRQQMEELQRQDRLRGGLAGLWDRLRGERKRTLERNTVEAETARQRDREEQERLAAHQLAQRRTAMQARERERQANEAVTRELKEDAKVFRDMAQDAVREAEAERAARREAFKERRRSEERPRRSRQREGPAPGR